MPLLSCLDAPLIPTFTFNKTHISPKVISAAFCIAVVPLLYWIKMVVTSDDFTFAIAYLCICFILYGSCLAIFRLYFSSLSHIPGPKIAIATWWYECFYDVWKRGVYYKEVKEFHQRYGLLTHLGCICYTSF